MAMFRNYKFSELIDKYQDGVQYTSEAHSFKLTLKPITPNQKNILDFDWKVTLSDGYEFDAPMGSESISFPDTRLGVIIERLKKANRYQDGYLANAINEKIDIIYRDYR